MQLGLGDFILQLFARCLKITFRDRNRNLMSVSIFMCGVGGSECLLGEE
jgi:hypothetical protein